MWYTGLMNMRKQTAEVIDLDSRRGAEEVRTETHDRAVEAATPKSGEVLGKAISVQEILGQEEEALKSLEALGIEDTADFVATLKKVVESVSPYFPVDVQKLMVASLAGKAVGKNEGSGGKVYMDPWAILDVVRGIGVLSHELSHSGTRVDIPFEAVADAYGACVTALYGKSDIQEPPTYQASFEAYERILEAIGGDRTQLAKKIWTLCGEGKYDQVFAMVQEAMDKTEDEDKKDSLFNDFQLAFPGLTYVDGNSEFGRAKIEL